MLQYIRVKEMCDRRLVYRQFYDTFTFSRSRLLIETWALLNTYKISHGMRVVSKQPYNSRSHCCTMKQLFVIIWHIFHLLDIIYSFPIEVLTYFYNKLYKESLWARSVRPVLFIFLLQIRLIITSSVFYKAIKQISHQDK